MTSDDRDRLATLWGKARPREGAPHPWHPLLYHCLDVAAVGEALLEQQPRWLTRLAALLGTEPEPLRRLVVFLLAIHDIGKISRPFQGKRQDLWSTDLLGRMGSVPAGPRHDTIGLELLDRKLRPELRALLPDWECQETRALLVPFFGHHGKPVWPGTKYDRQVIDDRCLAAAREFLALMRDLVEPVPLAPLSLEALHAASWELAGLAVLADWIGSSQHWFPYHAPNLEPRAYLDSVARLAAERAPREAGLLPARAAPRLTFSTLTGKAHLPSAVQRWAEAVALPDGPLLALIEEVTGGGKTEAALVLAHRLMAAGRARGLYVALPTMATANAMYGRLAEAYRRLFARDTEPSLALAHGHRELHDGFRRSVHEPGDADRARECEIVEQDSDGDDSGAACAAWLAEESRKAFLADVGVGTVDQALMAVLPAKYQSLRLLGLAECVLIVDEAHAYDAYMSEELQRLLKFQAALGGSAIVLSATLLQANRQALAAAFRRGLERVAPALQEDAYPLLTLVSSEAVLEEEKDPRPDLRRTLRVERLAEVETVLDRIAEAHARGAAIAWVRNAVDDALDAVDLLKEHGIGATLFHARFAMGDRLEIEKGVVERFGDKEKTIEQRQGVIITTQVLQESLDVDLDLIVTDLAPIDLMLQRAGRLWRHTERHTRGRKRPIEGPRLLVLGPEPVDDAAKDWYAALLPRAASVYRNHAVVWRSAKVLFGEGDSTDVRVPEDVRRLVEAVYGQLGKGGYPPALEQNWIEGEGAERAARSVAGSNLLDLAEGYGGHHAGWDDEVRVPTRLGEPMSVLRLARLEDGRLVPWYHDPDPRRAWALSEVSVRQVRVKSELMPPNLVAAAKKARATWTRFDEGKLLVPLQEAGDGTWAATALDPKSNEVSLRYDRIRGLQFG